MFGKFLAHTWLYVSVAEKGQGFLKIAFGNHGIQETIEKEQYCLEQLSSKRKLISCFPFELIK